jgi:hypothetical protein
LELSQYLQYPRSYHVELPCLLLNAQNKICYINIVLNLIIFELI